MANIGDRIEKNVPGAYYVDSGCIGCRECLRIAVTIFDIDEDTDMAYVKKQPATDDEKAAARRAVEECPVQAIGDDG